MFQYNSGVAVIDCIHSSDARIKTWCDLSNLFAYSGADHTLVSNVNTTLQKHLRIEAALRLEGKARQITPSEWKTLYVHTQRELVELRSPGAWELWVKWASSRCVNLTPASE